jgi:hypothetical protein
VAERLEADGIELVDPPRADGLVGDQARLLEHAEVLRDCGAADGEPTGEHPNGLRPGEQSLDDRAARGIAEGMELQRLVSLHER